MKKIGLSFLFIIGFIWGCNWDLEFPDTDCRYLVECPCTVEDEDGNVYNTVQIGNQCWMAENLKTGMRVDQGSDVDSSDNILQKLCKSENCIEGGFYKQSELKFESNGVRSICPPSWQLPTFFDFTILKEHIDTHSSIEDDNYNYLLSTFNPFFEGNYNLTKSRYEGVDLAAYFWAYNDIGETHYFWVRIEPKLWSTPKVSIKNNLFFNCRCIFKNN